MAKCDGGVDCKPTPLSWGLCTEADVSRNPDVCKAEGIGRDPAPSDMANPGQDPSLGYTHCTSCHEGDALEMVHPATQTGICRPFGPPDGVANLVSMPTCHEANNLIPRPGSKSQVCTQIYRPAVLYAGNTSSEPFLLEHNKYAYVTCNVRSMVTCDAGEGEKFDVLASPASYGSGHEQVERTVCKTEKQVSCATVCRLTGDGQLCLRGQDCKSSKSSTPNEVYVMRSQLLGTPHDLSQYDCDATRCEAKMCQAFATS